MRSRHERRGVIGLQIEHGASTCLQVLAADNIVVCSYENGKPG